MRLTRKTPDIDNKPPELSGFLSPPAEAPPDGERRPGKASGIRRIVVRWERLVNRPGLDFEESRKRELFAVLILPGICILLTFAIYHLTHDNMVEGILDLTAGTWLLLTLIAFRMMSHGLNIFRFNTAILGCLFLYLTVKGGVNGNKIMWSFSFPLIALYTLGKKEGLISTAVLYGLMIGILYLPLDFVAVYGYPPDFKIRFCVAFFLVGSLACIYEWVRERSQNNLEGERNKLEIEKSKLAQLSYALQEVNQALTISEERLTRAQAIARVGNLEYGVHSGMVWGSREALRILGIETPDNEFPLSVLKRILSDFEALRRDLEDCIRNDCEFDRELSIHRLSDGQAVVIHVKAEMVRNADGRFEKLIGVIQDITEHKAAEKEKRELEDKLARSQKMESLGLLAGGVAHDLNNVLSGMVGYPDLLLRSLPAGSPMTKPLQRIRESGQKAAAIVQDLLTLARRGVTNHKVLNLNHLLEEFLASPELANIQSWHPGIIIETSLDPDLLNIRGSAVHLKKTVMNLISNAAEALPDGGRVWVHTQNCCVEGAVEGGSDIPQGDYVIFQVEDNGIGISPQDLERIFEPFYTKKKMGRSGTGLGMSVVWGTVEDHKGYIKIDSSEGIGTRIMLYFPVTRESVEEREQVVPVDEYMGSGETILVVDDVIEQCELAQSMLIKLGYKVQTAAGGQAALDLLSGQSVDLVILDMIMDPGIDGLETYIRILELHPDQRAIIASGFSETERVRGAQRLGAKVYVKKPYTLEKLGVAVQNALTG